MRSARALPYLPEVVRQLLLFPEKAQAVSLINIKLIEGVFTPAQKREMLEHLTDTTLEVERENTRQVTWSVVEEVKSGNWGMAGNAHTSSTSAP